MRMRKRRHPSSSRPPALQPSQRKGGGDCAAGQPERTGYDTGTLQRTLLTRRWAPLADAHAGRVQAVEEWATIVHAAVAWSDVAPADDAEAPKHNNQPVGARG